MRILIVDDDQELVEVSSLFFQKHDYEVFTAHNGDEAWDFLKEEAVDIVIADHSMPGMTGLQLVQKMSANLKKLPAIYIVSGHIDDTADDFLDAGAAAVFEKPVGPKQLLDIVMDFAGL